MTIISRDIPEPAGAIQPSFALKNRLSQGAQNS
jgi:hypothetical protein